MHTESLQKKPNKNLKQGHDMHEKHTQEARGVARAGVGGFKPPKISQFRLHIYTCAHLQMHEHKTWLNPPLKKNFWLRPRRKHSIENFVVNINSSVAFCTYGAFGARSLKPRHPRFLPTSLSTPSYPPPPCSSFKAHPHLRLASLARPFVTGHQATQGNCC